MRVKIIKDNNIENFDLPKRIYGNYWIKDLDKNGDYRNLVNIEAIDNKWFVKSNYEIKVKINGVYVDQCELKNFNFYTLEVNDESNILLYSCPVYDDNFVKYKFGFDNISVGKSNDNNLVYRCDFAQANCCRLFKKENYWYLVSDKNSKIYVNDKLISEKKLCNGDIIFIYGLKIIVMKDFFFINNPNSMVSCKVNTLVPLPLEHDIISSDNLEGIDDLQAYDRSDYFYKSPRFKTEVEKVIVNIDPPPNKEKENDMPLIYTIGPMVTMGMTSVVTGYFSLSNLSHGTSTFSSELPNLIMTGSMLATMILWPILLSNYEKRKQKKDEKKRQEKYSKYIDEKRNYINNTISKQKQILVENSISLKECQNIILNKKRNLWERNPEHSDFLNLRIGIGTIEPSIEIKYPEEHFTMDNDNLLQYLNELVVESKIIEDVPINVSLIEKNITAVVGNELLTKKFIDGLILQIITFHSYDDVRLVLLTDDMCKSEWSFMKKIPHIWNENKTMRFYGDNSDDVKQITNYLNEEFKFRCDKFDEDDKNNYLSFQPYYIIIVDSLKIVRTNDFIKKLLEQKQNLGFSILIKNDKLSNLPNECSTFINIDKQTSGIFENELVSDKQKEFNANIDEDIDLETCALFLSRIPIEFKNSKMMLPNSMGFLEMYNVGMIEQLNILNRWKKNDPTTSLEAPVGVDENGQLFKLDLHEKASGPHGLIAGMTGSGKSEFIITYILSMAINYHPDEVQFVLIDYKGGGLAGAFENKDTGVKLPHLIGTITNLDNSEMNRSLASIQSELKRRQKIFNEARDRLNESTIDIYKYQKFYREGKVQNPVSHLFIISDEFAELKAQKPEFMDQLISTARIGRSLGVHLILATQKPSGVVDDQIWSNSKFRVCLKVQDKSDSMDMIKCPDAAGLKNVGRFYLQVGYNEFFGLGQSAWAGTQYRKAEKIKKKIDTSINFINNIGSIIKSINDEKNDFQSESYGEELPNIVKFLFDLGMSENIYSNKLWLDKIPQFIKIDDLGKKYNYKTEKFVLNPIIGEIDIPKRQQQSILNLQLSSNGNTIIYGSAGSGKELLFSTIIYSTIINHTAEEINFYILDFGSEALKMFVSAPQVGDVLTSIDEEKITNLFKMTNDIIEDRKKLFADYNGNYESYCKYSNKSVPAIVIMINSYESFSELFDSLDDSMMKVTREGIKYGVYFIVNVSGVSNIMYKLQQNFKQQIVLQLNDESDYSSILGNTYGLYPSKLEGRGLIKIDDIYEFQTASITEPENVTDYVKKICDEMKEKSIFFANPVPVLPDIVNYDFIKKQVLSINKFPVGVDKNSLDVVYYDFINNNISMIISQEIDNLKNFIYEFINCFKKVNKSQLIILDIFHMFDNEYIDYNNYFKDNYNMVFNKVYEYVNNLNTIINSNMNDLNSINKYNHLTCIIIGLNEYINSLTEEEKDKFGELLSMSKKIKKISYIVLDSVSNISSNEYENWFSDNFSNTNGIWVGAGFDDQITFKLSKHPGYINDSLSNQFGYVIKNGNPIQIKLLSNVSEEDD